MKGYVVREKDGELWFYPNRPERAQYVLGSFWVGNLKGSIFMLNTLFPGFEDLTWDDEPVKAELTIKRTDK